MSRMSGGSATVAAKISRFSGGTNMTDSPAEPDFTQPFHCSRCPWTEPHGHRGPLAIGLKDFTSHGNGLLKRRVVGANGEEHIELWTHKEFIDDLIKQGGIEALDQWLEQAHEARAEMIRQASDPPKPL
jgi:hypothetical protein